jgi:hypothetical protein
MPITTGSVSELDEAAANAQLTTHPTLYFEDGNVIVKTRSTLFCVHRTHSTVFCDLFAQNTQTLRGFPSRTVDDDRDDMESLLILSMTACEYFLYHHLGVWWPSISPGTSTLTVESFPALAGLLRITMKYQIQRPRAAIIESLKIQWPSFLEKHQKQAALGKHSPIAATEWWHWGEPHRSSGECHRPAP